MEGGHGDEHGAWEYPEQQSWPDWLDDHASALTGLPSDQALFILSQLVSLPLSFFLRLCLPASLVGESVRHVYCVGVGMLLTIACFRWQILNVLFPSTLVYAYIIISQVPNLGRNVLIASMGYLSISHMYRQYTDYGGYKLDITGPLMILVQKLSILAYAISDGQKDKETLKDSEHQKQRVVGVPSLLQYYSYLFSFLGFQTGPCFFYNDYASFIAGHNYTPFQYTNAQGQKVTKYPSTTLVTLKNGLSASVCMLVVSQVCPRFPVEGVITDWFRSRSIVEKLLYDYAATSLYRFRYYMAWKLGETICNASGFGFEGWTSEGKQKWGLVKNCSMWKLETAQSIKVIFDCWNTQTALWLRYICYTRIPRQHRTHATNLTFGLSAMWHGFYPGYYVCFTLGMVYVNLARKVRSSIRPFLYPASAEETGPSVGLRVARLAYHVITFVATHLALSFGVTCHILLRLSLVFAFFKSVYFYVLIISAILFVLPLPKLKKFHQKPQPESSTQSQNGSASSATSSKPEKLD